MNEIEYYLARAAGCDRVRVGEDITVRVDMAVAHDVTAPMAIAQFDQVGVDRVFDAGKVLFVLDHVFPAATVAARRNHRQMLDFAEKYHIRCYSKGEGVIHQIVAETKELKRGSVLIGADSHTCTAGAYGALAIGVGSTELAATMATGTIDLEVPPVHEIRLNGTLPRGVYAKDIVLHLVGRFGTSGFTDKGILFTGSWVKNASVEEKMTISNMAIEMGAMISYFSEAQEADGVSEAHCIDVAQLVPVLACPHSPGNVKPVTAIDGKPVTQVVIGSCTNGRLSDMRVAAEVFARVKVHPRVTCIVLPASREVAKAMEEEGLTAILRSAGATITSPGCGPCFGGHLGLVTEQDVVVSTTNRNFPGRMGAKTAEIFLASPRVAAETAAAGRIVSPGTMVPLEVKNND